MRKAKLVAIEFEVICPYCKEPCTDPFHFSFRWTTDETRAGQIVNCDCGKSFEIPKIVPSFKLYPND